MCIRDSPYPGWYYGHYGEFRELPRAPFVSEFGAQALPCPETLRETFEPEDLWPPNWSKWLVHDFQPDQTLNIVGIEMGESIEEFSANSQAYQARLLQFAIERYRAAKYTPVTGLFQFMFVECWPSITWAVVDYFRRPKQGYDALKQAYQPVLPAILSNREVFQRGDPRRGIRYHVAVINDLPQGFPEAVARTWILDPEGDRVFEDEQVVDLPPDGVVTCFQRTHEQGAQLLIRPEAPLGIYTIGASVHDANGELLGQNSWTVQVVPER